MLSPIFLQRILLQLLFILQHVAFLLLFNEMLVTTVDSEMLLLALLMLRQMMLAHKLQLPQPPSIKIVAVYFFCSYKKALPLIIIIIRY